MRVHTLTSHLARALVLTGLFVAAPLAAQSHPESSTAPRVALASPTFSSTCWQPLGNADELDPLGDDAGDVAMAQRYAEFNVIGACGHELEVGLGFTAIGGDAPLTYVPSARVDGVLVRWGRLFLSVGGEVAVPFRDDGANIFGYELRLRGGSTSASGRWGVWVEAALLPPNGSAGSPADWRLGLASAIGFSPFRAAVTLPRGAWGGLGAIGFRIRTADQGFHALIGSEMRLGTINGASPDGPVSGFTGGLALEAHLAHAGSVGGSQISATFRIGLRLEADLSAFWPTDTAVPVAVRLPIAWMPAESFIIELWGSIGRLALNDRTDIPANIASGGLNLELRL